MQKVGILFKTEQPSADEINDGLGSLNAMLSSWSNESMLISARTISSFPLVGGTGEYLIGAGQTFNAVRPNYIVESYVRIATIDYALTSISDEAYAVQIGLKSQQGIPEFINYNNAYPYSTIKLWPVPAANYTLYLLTENPLTTFALDDDVILPNGWEQALIYNLAVILAPEYGSQVDQMTMKIAGDSKAAIKMAIMKTRTMDAEWAGGATGNIYNGWYNT